jgi:hypothetical protein
MLRRVALVRADVSEECITSIIKMKKISKLGAKLAVTGNWITLPHGVISRRRHSSQSSQRKPQILRTSLNFLFSVWAQFETCCSHDEQTLIHETGSALKIILNYHSHGSIVVKALCYKPEGRGFETQWCEWFLSIYLILPVPLGPGIHSVSNLN